MRFVLTLLLLILGSTICYTQTPTLDVKGSGVKVVDVERTVIVKDKATVVASFPFTVTAPSGAAFYDWKYPAGVVATDDEGSILEVTSAPKGECTISVKMRSAKVVAGDVVFSTKTLRVTFTVGDVPGPGPKPPEPSADNPFSVAWKADASIVNKANYIAVVSALYRGYASEAKSGTKTGKQLFDFMSAAYLAAKSNGEPIKGKLPNTVTAVNVWLAANLKIQEGQLTAEERTNAEAAFLKISRWLEELR